MKEIHIHLVTMSPGHLVTPLSMTDPWYNAGLHFTCTRCGHCCTGAPGYVWVNEEEIHQIAAHLGESVVDFCRVHVRQVNGRFSLTEKLNHDCILWDRDKGCTVYSVRPRQCRTWPFWESNVRTPADWERTCRACPGAGQGELFSAEQISEKLRLVQL